MNRIARLSWDELTDLIEGIEACGQVPADELNRISSLPEKDYHLALHAYQVAAIFARRQEACRAAA